MSKGSTRPSPDAALGSRTDLFIAYLTCVMSIVTAIGSIIGIAWTNTVSMRVARIESEMTENERATRIDTLLMDIDRLRHCIAQCNDENLKYTGSQKRWTLYHGWATAYPPEGHMSLLPRLVTRARLASYGSTADHAKSLQDDIDGVPKDKQDKDKQGEDTTTAWKDEWLTQARGVVGAFEKEVAEKNKPISKQPAGGKGRS